ncbi:MAG: linear amide C-N hydrolase [Treponema sp.]|nr:linear amide C-N hydrolase [Treponema sp.]
MKKLLKFFVPTIGLLLALGLVSCNPSSGTDNPDSGVVTPPDDGGDDDEERIAEGGWNLAAQTLKAVNGFADVGVYSIEFDGEYFLSDVIDADLTTAGELVTYLKNHVPEWKTVEDAEYNLDIQVKGAACSSIVAKNKTDGTSGYIYGRNFDWDEGPALILHARPIDGYESISTCFLPFIDEGWEYKDNTNKGAEALGCIYVPMDGMNEKGLYIANLQSDTYPVMPEEGDTEKDYVQTTVAIRYILDKCQTVAEAVAWLKTINMCPVYADDVDENGVPQMADYHFAIADNTGKYVVAEWINGEFKTKEDRVCTNHSLVDYTDPETLDPRISRSSYERYDALTKIGKDSNWELTSTEVRDALKAVQKSNSVWSAVFEPGAKRVTYYFRKADPHAGIDTTDPDAVQAADDVPMDYTKPLVVQF